MIVILSSTAFAVFMDVTEPSPDQVAGRDVHDTQQVGHPRCHVRQSDLDPANQAIYIPKGLLVNRVFGKFQSGRPIRIKVLVTLFTDVQVDSAR